MRDEPAQMQTAPQLVQAKGLFIIYNSGGASRNRTADTEIFSLLLYLLS